MPPPPAPGSRTVVPRMGCGYAVCLGLALAGAALLFVANRRWDEARRSDAWVIGGVAAALCIASVGLIGPMQRAVRVAEERRRREELRPLAPWTWLDAWREPGGIRQTGRKHSRELLIFAFAAVLISSPGIAVLPQEWAKGNRLVALVFVFPLISAGIFVGAMLDSWRRHKYGVARFVPDALPIPLGGELAGMIVVSRPVLPNAAGRVTLDCWCASTQPRTRRSRQETIVAHTDRVLAPTDWTTTAHESRLFVQLPVRGGEATTVTAPKLDELTYDWRLRVEAPTAGADFVAEFVLPVFAVPGRQFSAGADAASTPADRTEVWRAAGIREEPQTGAAGDTALVMPSGLGRGLVLAPLLMTLGFAALAILLWWSPVPGFMAIFLALFAILPALALPSLWSGGGERIWIEAGHVNVQRGQRPLRRMAVSDVQAIEASKNVGVGAQQFYRVVARLRVADGRKFPPRAEVASLIHGDEAATAVVHWLEERLTRGRARASPQSAPPLNSSRA